MCCRTSFGRRFLLTFSVLALAFVALGLPPQLVFASGGVDDPSLVFQLEGNVITDASICFELTINGAFTAPPSGTTCPSGFTLVSFGATTDDWDVIATPPNHALASSFVGSSVEAINSTGDTIFTGGGAKDILGISSGAWAWKNGKPQGKDDIEHAFAAAYTLPNVVNGTSGIPCGGANQPACDTAVYFGMTRFDNSGNSTGGFWVFQV